jgi:hypothetical protein
MDWQTGFRTAEGTGLDPDSGKRIRITLMDWRTGSGTAEGTGLDPDSGKRIRITPRVVKAELVSGSGSRLLVVLLSSSSRAIWLKNKVGNADPC